MERSIRRRLDVLIALASCLVGIALTFVLTRQESEFFLGVSFFASVIVFLLALRYAEG